jgi:hypothetical protein
MTATETQVRIAMRERVQGKTQEQAAAIGGQHVEIGQAAAEAPFTTPTAMPAGWPSKVAPSTI